MRTPLRDIAASIAKMKVPIDAFVIRERVRVGAIEYAGNVRRVWLMAHAPDTPPR